MISLNNLPQPGSSSSHLPQSTQQDISTPQLKDLISHWSSMTFEPSQIPSLVQNVASAEPEKQCYGIIGLDKLASQEGNKSIIEAIVNSGVAPSMISLMKGSLQPEIKAKIASFLGRLCTGAPEQVFKLIDNGIIQEFLDVIQKKASDPQVVLNSLFGVLLIACESVLFRDMVLEQDGVGAIVKVLEDFSSFESEYLGILGFAILLAGEPRPHFPLVKKAIPWLCNSLDSEKGDQMLKRALSGFVAISSDKEGIESLMKLGLITKLVKFIASPDEMITIYCLEVIVNIASGGPEEAIVEVLKEKGLISELLKVIDHPSEGVRKRCYCILGWFTMRSESDVESIIGNSGLVEKIIKAVNNEKEIRIKYVAVCCLLGLTGGGSTTQCLENGVYWCLIDLLDVKNDEILEIALIGIENGLAEGREFGLNDENGQNKFLVEIEKKGGIEKMKGLLENGRCCEIVRRILEEYFEDD